MSHALHDDAAPVTIREFDAFLDAQRDDGLWELLDGQIVAMTNPNVAHALIVRNIGNALDVALPPDCRAFRGDVRVQRSENTTGTYKPRPDVLVHCGPVDQARNYVINPSVIVEVLSRGSMDNDRGGKLEFYKNLQTLRHIVLIYQDQMRVEHYQRMDTGWEMEPLTDSKKMLTLEAIASEISLNVIYHGIEISPH